MERDVWDNFGFDPGPPGNAMSSRTAGGGRAQSYHGSNSREKSTNLSFIPLRSKYLAAERRRIPSRKVCVALDLRRRAGPADWGALTRTRGHPPSSRRGRPSARRCAELDKPA